jgi:hypothetical protein
MQHSTGSVISLVPASFRECDTDLNDSWLNLRDIIGSHEIEQLSACLREVEAASLTTDGYEYISMAPSQLHWLMITC